MSPELLLQKLGVLTLLLSIIPGAWLGWRAMRYDPLFERIAFAFIGGVGVPCAVFCIGILLLLLGSALEFVLT